MGMSKAEAGRLGGLKTIEKHGQAHMAAIGRKGFNRLVWNRFGGNQADALAFLRDGKMGAKSPAWSGNRRAI